MPEIAKPAPQMIPFNIKNINKDIDGKFYAILKQEVKIEDLEMELLRKKSMLSILTEQISDMETKIIEMKK